MDAKDRLITARVRLQKDNPFFSYLVMNLNLIEKEDIKTCGVDCKGNLYYNSDFIDKLSNDEIKTLLCHEVLHIALLHLTRLNNRDKKVWNIATDIIINNTLRNNNFIFDKGLSGGLIPNSNNIKINDFRIDNLDKMFSEEVYNILIEKLKENEQEKNSGFDEHLYSDDDNEINEEDKSKLEKEWKDKLAEASTYSQMKGNLPVGIDRYLDKLLNNKLNWRELLYKYITQELPSRYTYSSPNRKSHALGVYLPKLIKEKVNISIAVDTSGSISKDDLNKFISEVIGISKSFENIQVNLISMDTQVNNHYVITNGDVEEFLSSGLTGGGGTDFKEVYSYIDTEIPNTKLLIFFTDGYAEYPRDESYKTLWVITKDGINFNDIPIGEKVRFED